MTADEQTAGRGRQGRAWLAPAGACLLCSLVLRGRPAPLLPLIAGVALCDAIDRDALVKWPNDIVLGEDLAKVAGILVEARPQGSWAVLGIGVNVALRLQELPPDVRSRAATLGLGRDAVEPLLSRLLSALQARLAEPPDAVLERWRALDALRGRKVSWTSGAGTAEEVDGGGGLLVRATDGGAGTAEGVDGRGGLLVRTADGVVVALSAGDVYLSAAG